jgi:plastocyanin
MRKFLVFLISIGASGVVLAEHVTLPAAASIVGGAPFFSDVRAFNESYTDDLTVEARYRCFIPSPCNLAIQSVTFTLTPRQSQAFNDIVVSQFNAPNTAGGIEFEFSGASDQLVVTSRLYSTQPQPTVGMFIPALQDSDAHVTTVLTSIRNGGPNAGFRTNVGVFNREDASAELTFTIFDAGHNQVGNPVTRSVPGHSGVQVNGIFNVAGNAGYVTSNAVVVVSASHEIFSYAAVIDNNTTDPIFVVGAEDQPQQPITPGAPTVTPTQQAPTPTRTPTVTPTQTTGGTRNVSVGQGGLRFVDEVSGTSTSTITVGQTVKWTFANGPHNVTSTSAENFASNDMSSGSFSHTFNQAGSFGYLCTIHGSIMSGTVVVNP